MAKLPVGTKVHCAYRHARKDSMQPWIEHTLEGVVIADNDPRIWADTIAFRGVPTQAQVDDNIAWWLANDLDFEDETPIDYGDDCYLWDQTDKVYPADNCPLCKSAL